MATQQELANFYVKIGALAKEFDKEYNRVEKTVGEASKKLVVNPKVNPKDLKSLNAEMDRLKDRAAELRGHLLTIKPTVQNPNAIKDLEHELQKVEERMRLVGDSADYLRSKWERLGEIGSKLALKLSAPIMVGLALATREAAKFEAQMRNVNSIAKLSESAFEATGAQVKKLAAGIGKGPSDLAAGLYDIASSGFSGADGLTVLDAAAKGAKAGLSTTAEAAAAITTVLNSYGLTADNAARVNDVMFKAVEAGVVTYAELGQNLGDVVATAAAAGVPFEQVAAGFATMTKGGINAAETATSLNRVILAFLNPSEKLAKALHDSGYESGMALLQTRGLASAVEYLQQVTGGSAEELAQLGLDARALKAALSLARDEGRVFAADLNAMTNATGAAQEALKEQSKSFSAQWEQAKASAAVFAISIGDTLIPVLKAGAQLLTKATAALSEMPAPLRTAVVGLALLAAAAGPALMLIGKLPVALLAARAGITALGASLTWLAAHPVVAVAAAIGSLIYYAVKLHDTLTVTTAEMIESTEQAIENAKAEQSQVEQTKKLVDQYEALKNKTNRTNVETAEMNLILTKIRMIMPELVKDGELVAGTFDKIGEAAKKSADGIKALQLRKMYLEEHKLKEEIAKATKDEADWTKIRDEAIYKGYAEKKRAEAEMLAATKKLELAQLQQQRRELIHGEEIAKHQNDYNNALKDQKAGEEDIAKAEAIRAEVAKRSMNEIGKLEVDRRQALKGAKGPLEAAAINEDFDDRIKRKRDELAQKHKSDTEKKVRLNIKADAEILAADMKMKGDPFGAERVLAGARFDDEMQSLDELESKGQNVDKQRTLSQKNLQLALTEINRRESENRRGIWKSEADAQAQTMIDTYRMLGRENDASYAGILDTYRREMIALDELAAKGEDVTERRRAAYRKMAADITALNKKIADEEAQRQKESEAKELRKLVAQEQANKDTFKSMIEGLQSFYDRLNQFLYGEGAMRLGQIDRWQSEQRKGIEETIEDEKLKADLLSAVDADAALQRAEIDQEEQNNRDNQYKNWIERMKQTINFTGIEGSWKKMMESGASLAFGTPQLTQQFASPNLTMQNQMSLPQIAALLQHANEKHDQTVRGINDMNAKLEGY